MIARPRIVIVDDVESNRNYDRLQRSRTLANADDVQTAAKENRAVADAFALALRNVPRRTNDIPEEAMDVDSISGSVNYGLARDLSSLASHAARDLNRKAHQEREIEEEQLQT
jgi:hypothetical protein